jgi:hypothetical protein
MRELGRGWSNFRTESKQYGIIVLLIREEGRDAYATTNMGQLRATIRWLPTGRQKHLVLDPILTNPRKKKSASKKAASLIKTPQYCRVLRRQVPPVAKLFPGVGSEEVASAEVDSDSSSTSISSVVIC